MIFLPWEFTYLIYDVEAPKEQESVLLLLVVYYRILMQHNMKIIFIHEYSAGRTSWIYCLCREGSKLT